MDIKKEYERWLENATADANVAAELKTLDVLIQSWRYANSSLRQHMNYTTFIAMSKMLTKVI